MANPERYAQAKRIFLEAGRLPHGERTRFLNAQCAEDSDLAAHVRRLLSVDESDGDFLETPAIGELTPAISEGMRLGHFRVVRVLGEGGMGIVYEVDEDEPRRRVALKVIRPGLLSECLRSRFRHEIRVLGQLRHPGIAQIYEAGTLEVSGELVPYFAMELVQGRALLQCVEDAKLGVRERLMLIAQICDAVHHAHQKGVIHRDLKPGNILVEEASGSEAMGQIGGRTGGRTGGVGTSPALPLQVKILDFGIARATDPEMQAATMQTDVGQLVGTVPYMSPEQVSGESDAVDIRSDVYAIGVIAFELLGGQLPYPARGRALHEAARMIHESEPARLGTIDRSLRGDIETIISKALEKDRERRYGSAAELASDVRRFLRDEPIAARPPSALYHLRTYARRHKPMVAAATLVALALIVGTAVSVLFAVREHRAHVLAVDHGREAERQATRVQRINEFLLDDLFHAGGGVSSEPDARLVDFLDAAVPRIPSRFESDPLMEAHLRGLVANMYLNIGRFQPSLDQIQLALTRSETVEDPLKARYLEQIKLVHGKLLMGMGRMPEAEAILRELLAQAQARESQHFLAIKGALAATLIAQRKFEEAEPMLLDVVEQQRRQLPDSARNYIIHWGQMAPIYYMTNRFEELKTLAVGMIAAVEKYQPDNHMAMNSALFWLSRAHAQLGNHEEAANAAVRVADYAVRTMPPQSPNLAMAQISAALVLSRVGRHQEADERARDGYKRVLACYGSRHYEAERQADHISNIYKRPGMEDEYRQWRTRYRVLRYYVAGPGETTSLDDTFKAAAAELGADSFADRLEAECATLKDDPKRARFYANAAWPLASHGQIDRALALLIDAAGCWKADDQPDEIRKAVRDRLPALLRKQGRTAEAEDWERRLESPGPETAAPK
jgi:eukaryotic-like serine/threonine-protein kinase